MTKSYYIDTTLSWDPLLLVCGPFMNAFSNKLHWNYSSKFQTFFSKKMLSTYIMSAILLTSWTYIQWSFCVLQYAPSQWEPTLQCNAVSHWLGACTKWSLHIHRVCGIYVTSPPMYHWLYNYIVQSWLYILYYYHTVSSLIGWAHTQNDSFSCITKHAHLSGWVCVQWSCGCLDRHIDPINCDINKINHTRWPAA